jgi:hypothetical protein
MKAGYGNFGGPAAQPAISTTKKAAQKLGGIASRRCIRRVTKRRVRDIRVALLAASTANKG